MVGYYHASVCGSDGKARDCKSLRTQFNSGTHLQYIGLLAQLDRASRYEREGWRFESFRDRQVIAGMA